MASPDLSPLKGRIRLSGSIVPKRAAFSQSETRSPGLDTPTDGSKRFDCQIFRAGHHRPVASLGGGCGLSRSSGTAFQTARPDRTVNVFGVFATRSLVW
ncbi:unnamed protein product, partial [Nesidiocoris tenuis]